MGSFSRAMSFWRFGAGESSNPRFESSIPVAEDHRVWVRFPSNLATTFQSPTSGGQESLQAKIRNVSRGGLSLLADRGFEPGSLLSIEPPSGDQSALAVLVYVVHARRQDEQSWVLGCTFARELNDADLVAFGTGPLPADATGHRTASRHACSVAGSYQVVADDLQERRGVRVLNLSGSGALVETPEALETGTLLSLQLSGPREGPPVIILGCVVHRRFGSDGQWTIGCNFIRELTEAELDLLL
jgi:hypothetical protein